MPRRSCWVGWIIVATLSAAPAAAGPPHAADWFPDAPGDTLVVRAEPQPGFSLSLAGPAEAVPPQRWKWSTPGEDNRVATDPQTGLCVLRRIRKLPELGFAVIETTLDNCGTAPLDVAAVSPGDWTFHVGEGPDDQRFRPLVYRSDVWYGSTFWSGPDWTRVGKDWHHPGQNTPSVRRFTFPRDGRVTVTGRVFKLHQDGDGVRVMIQHRGKTLWEAEIEGKDGRGLQPKLELDVRRGDKIRFIVHKRGQIYCDTTGWDPVVAYAGGPRFQASESFSTTKQGEGGWSYEMIAEEGDDLGLPQLHALGRDLGLLHLTPGGQAPAEVTGDDALPLGIVSDGANQSGVVVALSGDGPWRMRSTLSPAGLLRVELALEKPPRGRLGPGETVELPRLVFGAYQGSWLEGLGRFERLLAAAPTEAGLGPLADQVSAAVRRVAASVDPDGTAPSPELALVTMVQADWQQQDKLNETPERVAAATAEHLDKARQLLEDLRTDFGPTFLAREAGELARLSHLSGRQGLSLEDLRRLYRQVRWLKRRIVLANPRMQFGELLFNKRVPTSYSHQVMQYYGWRARPGGGLFVLERPGYSLACRDILDGRLASGNVLEPRLSYDARRIVFSWVECRGKHFDAGAIGNDDPDEGYYHIYEVGVDGTGLRQLTGSSFDDVMPTYLPDGGIAFCSTRRQGYSRCFGGQFSKRWDVYTLHRMDADGSNIRTLSFHDTNEWFPAVSNTGHLLYARWDYIDRDAVTHQNLWSTRPDGTNPVALWGNATPKPHCTFQVQPVPDSSKIVFTASAHHSVAAGPITLVDPTVSNDGQAALRRITPEVPFPEAETRDIREYYAAPWPLSEKYYLAAYSPKPLVWEPGAQPQDALGLYYVDAFGNRELIYRDPAIGSTNPCPLVPRPVPPVLASELPERAEPTGEMLLADVNRGLGDVARGTIRRLRIVQIFPKTTNVANNPPIGAAREENGRAILGTVPVEPDGSAYFTLPARKPVLFQALDEDGFAYQTMRTVTYVQPGERVSCVGCHEHRRTTPLRHSAGLAALGRPPSDIDPGELGGRPFSYVEVVQPILDRRCVECHGAAEPDGGIDLTGRPDGAFTRSYVALTGDVDFWGGGTNPENARKALVPRFGGRNQVQVTPPGGLYGARKSRLVKLLREGHEDVELTPDELAKLAAWIDLNAIFYGVYLPEDQAAQLEGEVVGMPEVQ